MTNCNDPSFRIWEYESSNQLLFGQLTGTRVCEIFYISLSYFHKYFIKILN